MPADISRSRLNFLSLFFHADGVFGWIASGCRKMSLWASVWHLADPRENACSSFILLLNEYCIKSNLREERIYSVCTSRAHVIIEESQGRNSSRNWSKKHWVTLLAGFLTGSRSAWFLLSHPAQAHLPREGTVHSGLGLPISGQNYPSWSIWSGQWLTFDSSRWL